MSLLLLTTSSSFAGAVGGSKTFEWDGGDPAELSVMFEGKKKAIVTMSMVGECELMIFAYHCPAGWKKESIGGLFCTCTNSDGDKSGCSKEKPKPVTACIMKIDRDYVHGKSNNEGDCIIDTTPEITAKGTIYVSNMGNCVAKVKIQTN